MAKFIEFKGWEVWSKKGQLLGYMCYYEGWKKHVFEPLPDTQFDCECQFDIGKELKKRDLQKIAQNLDIQDELRKQGEKRE